MVSCLIVLDSRRHVDNELKETSASAAVPRLSENREPTAEKRTLVHFPAHFR